ncbi:MAG: hypothetical protein ACP5NO_03890 [Thermoplasmata archaeon]
MKGTLIVFRVERSSEGVTAASYSRFYRKLYGYNNYSHYGRYHSRIPGFLDGIRHIKYANGVIAVDTKNSNKVIRFLRSNKAKVHSWSVDLSKKEEDILNGSDNKGTD